MKYKNILDTIGNTPVVELKNYSPNKSIKILAKLEGTNPGGSIKDRIALYMIRRAEKWGLLDKKKKILEATSGNTGIGLAFVSAVLGYRFTAVMPNSVSLERKKLLKAYGAEIIYTDGKRGTDYAIRYANNLYQKNKDQYIMLDQFNNPANVMAHFSTTGKEIIRDVSDITHFVAGMGTGGTLMGVGKRLKKHNKNIKVIGVEPKKKSKIQGLRNMSGFTPGIFHADRLDMYLKMKRDTPAFALSRSLFTSEGISVGMSSGANLWGALQIAQSIKRGVIVVIFPDKGDKYLSTSLLA